MSEETIIEQSRRKLRERKTQQQPSDTPTVFEQAQKETESKMQIALGKQQPTDTQMLYKFIMYLREHDYDVVELMQHKQRFLQYISNSNGEL